MSCRRAKISVQGAVQGVGFRPFVYRLATELGLAGTVANSNRGVDIEVEGEDDLLESFLNRLERERPPRASISRIERDSLVPRYKAGFKIGHSRANGAKSAVILPDIATCEECLREMFDPANRRYGYPFTNCTNCGPRFSIIESVPYDRANTSMKRFGMCELCQREYRDPAGRRFHAQPNACAACGPQLELWEPAGHVLAKADAALPLGAQAIRAGSIVAVKGIGGFQLLADARNSLAVHQLRERKNRPDKPFAVMFPSIAAVETCCEVSGVERNLLTSPEAPIVLLQRLKCRAHEVTREVAPANPRLGVLLPYSPLHHLLMRELEFPVVATSGNISDEPICIDEAEALETLRGIPDLFLVHDRPIVRPVDDSIVQEVIGRPMILRRARGYAPLPIEIETVRKPILALGGHLKNTVSIATGTGAFLSQHLGNLETERARAAFRKAASDLVALYDASPAAVVRDLHPDYFSSSYSQKLAPATISVQHHYAHVLSCMGENGLKAPVLGIAWDGTGLGEDDTIWGGEFLLVDEISYQRVAHLRQFPLPGGEASVREPRRSALGLLYEIFGDQITATSYLSRPLNFSEKEWAVLKQLLKQRFNAPLTSSAGRLFDGISALVGLRALATFEGQAAMELEFAIEKGFADGYPFSATKEPPHIIEWEPAVRQIMEEVEFGVSVGRIAAKFHNGLANAAVAIAEKIGVRQIALTGGCFQNRYLVQAVKERLTQAGFQVYWHSRIPPNDGGLALGQVIAASRILKTEDKSNCFSLVPRERASKSSDVCNAAT
jgi:hydrogenase maturation protein HypF